MVAQMIWFFYGVSVPLVGLAILYMLRFMPAPDTHWFVRFDVGMAWAAALSTLVLVPTDVATAMAGTHPVTLPLWWTYVYWYCFIAQMTVLPFHQEYVDSGQFTVLDRLLVSLKNNIQFYLLLAVLGVLGVLVLLASGMLALSNVAGFAIACSNAFGLIAGIFLMGYGLVAIPRQLWRMADVKGRQRLLCHKAGVQAKKSMRAHQELTMTVAEVHKVETMFGRRDPMRRYMDKITAMANGLEEQIQPEAVELPDNVDLDYFDKHDLGRLRRKLRNAIQSFQRERELYVEIVRDFFKVEDIINNMDHMGEPFVSTVHREIPTWLGVLEWWWKCKLSALVYRALAVLLGLLSVAVVVAEASISPKLPNLSLISHALHRVQDNQTLTELLCFAFLAYPCMCAYYGLYKMGQFDFYLLVPGHTPSYSLLANAMLMSRFAAPLAFNFMAALALPPSDQHAWADVTDTVFYKEFGALMMRQPVIGLEFTKYMPLALVPYVILQVFNVFNRVLGFFVKSSYISFDDDWETKSEFAASGLRLLRQELENYNSGQQLGLTIMFSTHAAREEQSLLGASRPAQPADNGRWWRPKGWPGSKPEASPPGAARTSGGASASGGAEVDDARSRLARVVGRGRSSLVEPAAQSSGGLGASGGASRRLFDDDDEDDNEGSRLFAGPVSSEAGKPRDLDSIFDRFENSGAGGRGQTRYSALPLGAAHALNVESDNDSDVGGGTSAWFRRAR